MLTPLMIGFLRPERLWWLLLVPVIAALYILANQRLSRPGRNPARRLDRVLPHEKAWRRHLSVAASLLSLASLVVAFSQPTAFTDVPRERATIVLAIDVSRSMIAQDVQPDRLTAAKNAATDFVEMLPLGFNVGVVAFAGTASIVVPPTTDRGAVSRAIETLEVAPSTAIGEGIFQSLNALRLAPEDPDHPDDPAPGAIVLLSDGSTNVGRSSTSAAEAAVDQGVPIYTIAYGTPGGYVIEGGRREPVPVDHSELARISSISKGKKFSAESSKDLEEVYRTIARSIGYTQETTEITDRFAGISLAFALLAALGVISLAARWP